jgi:putative flippase GtrA
MTTVDKKIHNTMWRFISVGAVGFVTDGAILYLLKIFIGPIYARFFSFLVAVTVTWLGNRHYTFKSKNESLILEYFHYLLMISLGSGINLAIYFSLVLSFKFIHHEPIIALCISSTIASVANYLSAKHVVFKNKFPQPKVAELKKNEAPGKMALSDQG